MKRIIDNVVSFPNGCETYHFAACYASALMRAENMINEKDYYVYCDRQKGDCISCGACGSSKPQKKHENVYNLYATVCGATLFQMDLSSKEHMSKSWDTTVNNMSEEFDDYIKFTMDFAGYNYEALERIKGKEIDFSDIETSKEYAEWVKNDKAKIFTKIKTSVGKNKPVLFQLNEMVGHWMIIIGYDDDNMTLYGYDGSFGYWGKNPINSCEYEDKYFFTNNWYEYLNKIVIFGDRKEPSLDMKAVYSRASKIMQEMQEKKYFQNSHAFMMDDSNFVGKSLDELITIKKNISQWIGLPIDMRSVLCWHINVKQSDPWYYYLKAIDSYCCGTHDILWIAWRAIGEYMDGEEKYWARGLENKIVRRAIADVIEIVAKNDVLILERLKDIVNS